MIGLRLLLSGLPSWLVRPRPLCDVIAPDPVDDLRELRLIRGLSEIHRSNVEDIARRRQLLSACESSPLRKVVNEVNEERVSRGRCALDYSIHAKTAKSLNGD